MRQVHFCSFLFQTYNHSITVTQAFPVKNTFNLESFFSGIQIIRSHSPFCSRTLCAGRRNVYDFLFRKAIHFQSTEFARRADNQRSAGLPGGLADSNKAVYART